MLNLAFLKLLSILQFTQNNEKEENTQAQHPLLLRPSLSKYTFLNSLVQRKILDLNA